MIDCACSQRMGKLVDEFNELDQFDGWQPDSGAIVFTTQGSHPDRRMIHYYQPADRTLKTYENILPTGRRIS